VNDGFINREHGGLNMESGIHFTALTKTEAITLLLEGMDAGEIKEWVWDLFSACGLDFELADFIAEHEDESVVMEMLLDKRPDLCAIDEQAAADQAANDAYDSWKDAGLTGHR